MDQIREIIVFVQVHWAEIGLGLLLILRGIESFVSLTETKKDDKAVAKAIAVIKNFFKIS